MRKSKILFTTILLIGVLVLVTFVTAGKLLANPSAYPDGFYVHGFDSQIADLRIINGQKEIFAVKVQDGKYNSYYNLYDRKLNVLLETELSLMGEKAGRFQPMGNHKDQWWLLDTETLQLRETDLINPQIHESGEYMIGQRKVKGEVYWTAERTRNGAVLYEGRQKLQLTSQPWYVIAKASTDEEQQERDQIINLRTGEVEYTAKDGESIVQGGLGYWEVDYELVWDYVGREEHFFGTYLLDDNYEMAFDGQLFGSVYLDGAYLCGELDKDKYMKDIDRLKYNTLGWPGLKAFVWTASGERIYSDKSNMYTAILGIRDNVIATRNSRDQYEYWVIEKKDGKAQIARKMNAGRYFNYLDMEDGFMRACKELDDSIYQLTLKNVPENEQKSTNFKAESYRWSFVNREMEEVLPFDYTYVSETEGGFAIVKNSRGQLAIIDLKVLE